MKLLFSSIRDAWHLFYPDNCIICESFLPVIEEHFCLSCYHSLSWTDHHEQKLNAFTIKFAGRLNPEKATALLYFHEGGQVQQIIHQLKYLGDQHLAKTLGGLLAKMIKMSPELNDLDYIIPVPLHRKKKIKRGYNQAHCIARGIAEVRPIEILNGCLIKKEDKGSQTRKSRSERFENVLNSFVVANEKDLSGKHVLIVDDVCTTGATLEACAVRILEKYECRISFAVLALAQ